MLHSILERTDWRAVILGWAVAIAAGIVLNLFFEAAHVLLFGGEASNAASLTTGVVAIPLVSGFLAHYGRRVRGRQEGARLRRSARRDGCDARLRLLGGRRGGVSAILLATAGIVLVERVVTLPSVTFGFAGGALFASLALLALNLLGGFFGGKPGGWETGPVSTSRGATRTPSE